MLGCRASFFISNTDVVRIVRESMAKNIKFIGWAFAVIAIYSCLFFSLFQNNKYLIGRLVYRAEAFVLQAGVECEGSVRGLDGIIKKVSLPYFSHNGKVVYIDEKGNVSSCVIGFQDKSELVFRLGSLTKALTSFALIDIISESEGHFTLPFLDFFPEIDSKDFRDEKIEDVTLYDLMNHSSGFGGPFGSDNMVKKGERPWCPYDFQVLKTVRLAGVPGTNHVYSNVSYCLLGEIISRIVETDYKSYIKDKYFAGYESLEFLTGGDYSDEPDYDFSNEFRFDRDYIDWLDFHALAPAAGLKGSPLEFARLLWSLHIRDPEKIFNGRKVSACDNGSSLCYSYGFMIKKMLQGEEVAIQHGYMPGASSLAVLSPTGEVVVWVAAGAPSKKEKKEELLQEVMKFLSQHKEVLSGE